MITVIVALVTVACFLLVQSVRMQLYTQRTYSLEQTTEKIVQIMNTVINNEWERLNYISSELAHTTPANTEALLARLSYLHSIDPLVHAWQISCVDENGSHYRWNGKVDRWTKPEYLLPDQPNYQILLTEARGTDAEQMLFLYRLPASITLPQDGTVLTHVLITLDMATFGEALEVSAFGNASYSYITDENGSRLYHQQNQSEFIAAYNILTAIQQNAFLFDSSYEALLAAIAEDTPYAAELERGGARYFVAYAPLSVNNWSLFLFVPEQYVGGETAHVISSLLLQVSAIAVLLIVLISLFVWNNAQQTLKRQQIAVDEARSASNAKSEFLSHMSHDIRTPLNGIMGMCHIARQRLGDAAAVEDCLEKIDLSSHQLMALINDVLDMSRIENDKVTINLKPVDLHELIRSCSVRMDVAVYENHITYKEDVSGVRHPCVSADPVLLEKILSNLLGNAAKFTPAGGSIRLTVSEQEMDETQGLYRFEIADTGVGMTPEFLDHLFEPFSQEGADSRTKYQGTGLGLSIVKNLVDKLGGSIEVQSELGKGSSFIVTLPLCHEAEAQPVQMVEESDQPFDGTGLHVLLVEDNEINRIIAQTVLEECHLTVDTADDGDVAVACFERSEPGTYDLILMDVRMPVMDGYEATRRIRALPRPDAKTIPIIALTADAMSGDMEKTHESGMNDHLGKPLEIKKLHAMLRAYCTKTEG